MGSMGWHDKELGFETFIPGSIFLLNPHGFMSSFAVPNFSTLSVSTASSVLRRNRASPSVFVGISFGGFFIHLTEFMIERSAACEVALIIIDALTRIPYPACFRFHSCDTLQTIDSRATEDLLSRILARNAGVAHRSKSRLLHCAMAVENNKRPGALVRVRQLHEF